MPDFMKAVKNLRKIRNNMTGDYSFFVCLFDKIKLILKIVIFFTIFHYTFR